MWDAACVTADPEVFFPLGRRDPANRAAKRVCAGCPARAECLQYSLVNEEEHGTWGGLDEWERRDLLAARRDRRGSGPQGVA
jgi:WhiB family transcriptional regulator, redox-sensing transcriptional regulator